MIRRLLTVLFALIASIAGAVTNRAVVLTVVGAGGEEGYQKQFEASAGLWEKAAQQAGAQFVKIGAEEEGTNDIGILKEALGALATEDTEPLWLVFLGHGTFDGKEAKFNLRGPDISAGELSKLLDPFRRPLVIINAASASAPFLNALSRTNRVIVTATRSGYEQNYARLGKYISEAIADPAADLDKDGQTSLLEAFVMGSRKTADFYSSEGRLATEHALLDDNGDGAGTQADWFRGVRAVKKPEKGASIDGLRAHQIHLVRSESEQRLPPEVRARRDELELSIATLRESKAAINEAEYYRQLEPLLIEISQLYNQANAAEN
jgi:hypothetical protein